MQSPKGPWEGEAGAGEDERLRSEERQQNTSFFLFLQAEEMVNTQMT